MAKLVFIDTDKRIKISSSNKLYKLEDATVFFRPQSKNAYIIADDNKLEGK